MTETVGFEPKILGFLCNWCSYAGADLAGVSRFQYPPTVRVIRVMCSGRVDPAFVLRAFSQKLDGVMVLGCHPGDCHYATGNFHARNRMKVVRRLLELAEVHPDRLILDWVSAGEGQRFAAMVAEFTDRIIALGPLGQSEGLVWDELRRRLAAAVLVVSSRQLRWLVGRKEDLLREGNVFGQAVDEEAYDQLLETSLVDEYVRSRLLVLASDRPLSAKDMATEMGVTTRSVLPHIVELEQAGLITVAGIEDRSPTYVRA
jgi:coenzyme F420-reducing hydrogenase delta subunit